MDNEMIPEQNNLVNHPQEQEFSILGIKLKYRATIVAGILSLSLLLNVFLVRKVMSIQQELYERVIQEITPKVETINQNVRKTNEKIDDIQRGNENENKNDNVDYGE